MSYRSSSPISGFAGHVPGNKWHVGGKQSQSDEASRRQDSHPVQTMQNGANFAPEQFAQMYQQQMAQLQANGQMPQFPMMSPYPYGFNPYVMNGMNGFNPNGSMQGLNQIGAQSQNGQRPDSSKTRSKSVPRKQPKSDVKDIFGGIESGWWSEGQALKNLRRHQQGLLSENGINGQYLNQDSTVHSTTSSKKNSDWDNDNDVPTPGYSGHVPGIKQYGIGKPFTVAAKEARRIMHGGNDSTQVSASSAHSAAMRAKNAASSQDRSNGYPPSLNQSFTSSSQNPFMQSYPYGMMPMYMNNMQQMPIPPTPQNPSEYGR